MRVSHIGLGLALAIAAGGCTVVKVADGGPFLTRAVKVIGRDVAIFNSAEAAPRGYVVVEEVWLRDDGSDDPEIMRRYLAEKAGATGANGLILASTNRTPNGLRVDLKVRLDNPFDYYAGTAIWVGPGERPVKVLRGR